MDALGQNQEHISQQVPDNSQKEPISLNQQFLVRTSYEIVCPHCNSSKIQIRSDKAGQGIIKCPHCKGKSMLKIVELAVDANVTAPASNAGNGAKAPIDLGDEFYVKRAYTVTCPHCDVAKFPISQDNEGAGLASCPECNGRVKFTVRKPTEMIVKSELIQRYRGKLILLRRGWLNKNYKLHEGKNTVGRHDDVKMSDIAIKGDPSMSRQSIEIFVDHREMGYSFKLTVKNAANPVLLNDKPMAVGDSISLNFGDSITLGNTKFRFDKDS